MTDDNLPPVKCRNGNWSFLLYRDNQPPEIGKPKIEFTEGWLADSPLYAGGYADAGDLDPGDLIRLGDYTYRITAHCYCFGLLKAAWPD